MTYLFPFNVTVIELSISTLVLLDYSLGLLSLENKVSSERILEIESWGANKWVSIAEDGNVNVFWD